MTWTNKHGEILKNGLVNGWYKRNARRSLLSADVWLRNLDLYCHKMDTTPEGILELARKEKLRSQFREFVDLMSTDGKAGSYINKYKTVLNNFVAYHDINYKIVEKVDGANDYLVFWGERIPTPKVLNRVLSNASLRGRVAISLMAFAGLRPETIGNYDGSDGLKLGDLEVDINTLEPVHVPAIIRVRRTLSKARTEYLTLIGNEGMDHIKAYLKDRKDNGETLSPESPLLAFDTRRNHDRFMPRTLLVTKEIRKAFEKSDLKGTRPYILRRYFAAGIEKSDYPDHQWRAFVMGHTGTIETLYSKGKGNLRDDQVEDLRKYYETCLEHLETITSLHGAVVRVRKEILSAIYSDSDLKGLDFGAMTESEFNRMITEKMPKQNTSGTNHGNMKSETVPVDRINEFEEMGYFVKCPLQPGYVLMVPLGYPGN